MPAIYPVEQFPALARFSAHWRTIRDEVVKLDRFVLPLNRHSQDHDEVLKEIVKQGRNGWMNGWGPSVNKWLNYGMRYQDSLISEHVPEPALQKTLEIVSGLRGVKVVALSLFLPGCYLLPHRHPELAEEGCLTYHIGLQTPARWHYLNVDGEFTQHKDGEPVVFDGSKMHFALNFSNEERLVLYMEFYKDRVGFEEPKLVHEGALR